MERPFVTSLPSPDGFHEVRRQTLAGEVYDKLSALTPEARTAISSKVTDPILDPAFVCLSENDRLLPISRERFVSEFRNFQQAFRSPSQSYIRALVLLELTQDPRILSRLQETSSYFPHRLFAPKPSPMRELEREIAALIPSLVPEDLIPALSQITDYIAPLPGRSYFHPDKRLGPYQIHREALLYFKRTDTEAIKKLEQLFEGDTKKSLLESLAETYLVGSQESERSGHRGKALRNTLFKVSPWEYAVTIQTLKNYATNQILNVWQNSGGTTIPQTRLARTTRIHPQQKGLQLSIQDRESTSLFRVDSKWTNTTIYLPICAFVLNRLYQNALTLCNPKEKA